VKDDAPTPEDYESVARAGDELLRRGWRNAFSVNEVVATWETVVEAIEAGYQMTIDDFTNDVSIRRWPEEARPMLTANVAKAMDDRLRPLDARFREATTDAAGQLPGAGAGGIHWWERRLPLLLVGELAEDVERMKLLP
jgi:hypothetical protein